MNPLTNPDELRFFLELTVIRELLRYFGLANVTISLTETPVSDSVAQIDREGHFIHSYPLTILIVDDWLEAAESLGIVLGFHGHTIHLANDGAAAVEKAEQVKPDVVLLDVAMPRMTGLDVAKILADQVDKKPLLIAISGYGTNEDRTTAYKAGFDHFFVKPINPDDLLHILEEKENHLLVTKRKSVGT